MGSFKLGGMTMRSLFSKPETTCYPFEKKPMPEGLKGHVANDMSTCILCGICQKTCPADAIVVDKAAGTWSIDRFRCVQCKSCTRACPKSCLTMEPEYTTPTTKKSIDVFSKPDAAVGEKATKEA
jgi:formate hydrogenlyase subunit 6/NADH:ubiquinone oxidoreductase subunit I